MATKRQANVSVLVVDDHRTFAEALAIAIGTERGIVVNIASSGREAIELIERDRPDIVLMDVEMPGAGGIETTRRVCSEHPESRVIVLSAHEDELIKARALEAGASGYLSKHRSFAEVSEAIRMARQGERLIERDEELRLLKHLRHQRHQEATERQRANRLTPRQLEVLQLLADGKSPRMIAQDLEMSDATLRTHMQNILTRLGAHSKLEAVALAIRHGKVTPGR
jgi:DNA-binding NarL/FixJ family response regulator